MVDTQVISCRSSFSRIRQSIAAPCFTTIPTPPICLAKPAPRYLPENVCIKRGAGFCYGPRTSPR
ncbi:hypothetical protein LA5095_00969 [Roseibium album]|uniref:Uncharacterized protein n=1 Tax=Roseibium album TaxID=311410 RepID=A0A0M6ZDH6_9HYPH|nr:hypothetical protein LA5094_03002 [Roseibium album]CTQ66832.1 hypothetical protein LA5095_00969 [Roseibium album]CTQ74592.1 hypothetical protein LA5096_04107 [Roseibium album]